jgi:hypothetical protein
MKDLRNPRRFPKATTLAATLIAAASAGLLCSSTSIAKPEDPLSTDKALPIRWEIEPLALDANEGCAIGDVDGDAKLDIVAGRHWYKSK